MSLKLNRYVQGVSAVNNNLEKLILNVILWSFAGLALSYFLILGNMVKNIVERQSFEIKARSLSSEIRDLEVAYLSMSGDVDLALSSSMGFKEAKPVYATRKSLVYGAVSGSLDGKKITQNEL